MMEICFGFLTFVAAFHVFFYKLSESGAFIKFLYKVPGVAYTQMSSSWGVMNLLKYGLSLFKVVRKIDFLGEKVVR